MADDSLPNEQAALPTRRQSLWFPAVPASAVDRSQDEPKDLPPPKQVTSAASILGWKAPARMRVPIFERDAAEENTTPGSAPSSTPVDACIDADPGLELVGLRVDEDALVATLRTTDKDSAHALAAALSPAPELGICAITGTDSDMPSDTAEIAQRLEERMRIFSGQTANDQTVQALNAALTPVPPDDPDFREVRVHRGNVDFHATRGPLDKSVALTLDFLDMNFPPKGAEMASGPTAADCAARFRQDVHSASPNRIPPPKGAQAAQAPADPCGRDGATPNDGAVLQGAAISIDGGGQDDRFSCALWSNGTFTIYPSDGPRLALNVNDTRLLINYVREVLSQRVRTEA